MAEYISLIEIGFTSGTRYYSYQGVSAPSNWYKDQVISVGEISREISMVPGEYRVSDCSITFSNADLEFSILKATESFRGKSVTIRFGNPDSGLAAMTTVFVGKITSWSLSPGQFEISITDITTQKFERTIGGLISSGSFSSIDSKTRESLYPIIYGYCYTYSNAEVGAVPCRLVDTTGPFLYLVARHVCKGINAVYRMGQLVPSSEYTVTTSSVDGYTMTFLSFTIDQRDLADLNTGTEIEWPERQYTTVDDIHITADVAGATDDGATSGTVIGNPVDQLKHFLKSYCGFVDGDFDATLWTNTATKLDAITFAGDWVLTENMILREFIEQFCKSYGLSFFITRAGLIGIGILNLSGMADLTSATEYSDSNDISNLTIRASDEYASKLQYRFLYSAPKDYYAREPEAIDYTERANLGGVDKSAILDMRFCFDYWTAWQVVQARMSMMREAQNVVEFVLPIENYNIDLNSVIKLTHREGIGSAGYSQRGALVLGTTLSISASSLAIKITALPVSEPFVNMSYAGSYAGHYIAVSSNVFIGGAADVFKSSDGGSTWNATGPLNNCSAVYEYFNHGNNTIVCGGQNSGVGHVWRSIDNGNTWSNGTDLSGTTKAKTFVKLTSGRLLAFCQTSTGGQIYYSDDSGNSWSNLAVSSGWAPNKAVETATGNLAAAWFNTTDNYTHARTSTDNGATWTDRGALGTADECYAMVNAGNGIILAGVGNDTGNSVGAIYRSTNNGANWSSLTSFTTLCSRITALVNMGNGVYLAGDGGEDDGLGWYTGGNIRYSSDNGTNWRILQRLGLAYQVISMSNPSGNTVVAFAGEMAWPQSAARCYKASVVP